MYRHIGGRKKSDIRITSAVLLWERGWTPYTWPEWDSLLRYMTRKVDFGQPIPDTIDGPKSQKRVVVAGKLIAALQGTSLGSSGST